MLGEVIEKAAELADSGEPTVEGALEQYDRTEGPMGSRPRQIWVSVAFLFGRQDRMSNARPR